MIKIESKLMGKVQFLDDDYYNNWEKSWKKYDPYCKHVFQDKNSKVNKKV